MSSEEGPRPWRQSLAAKAVAIGFSMFIVVGNVWLALALVGAQVKSWVGVSFAVALGIVALGGLALGARQIAVLCLPNTKFSSLFW
ncbi:MAG: hypothetical protein NTZ90_07290 [Proteobacteria bacterium]|nr:hypothetical protein [Pseudomonadota bacterium]